MGYVCSFSAGLDEMARKDQRDPIKVLAVLKRLGRFSVFEATETAALAKSMDRLASWGLMVVEPLGFPWSAVKVTERGERALADGCFEPPAPTACRECRTENSRHWVANPDGTFTCGNCKLKAWRATL